MSYKEATKSLSSLKRLQFQIHLILCICGHPVWYVFNPMIAEISATIYIWRLPFVLIFSLSFLPLQKCSTALFLLSSLNPNQQTGAIIISLRWITASQMKCKNTNTHGDKSHSPDVTCFFSIYSEAPETVKAPRILLL